MRRVDYSGDGLVESDVAASPYLQARAWVDAALAAAEDRDDVPEPTALSVATVDATGTPDVRTVLMRFLDERGPGFVTNLGSAKSEHLQANPRVAAALTWPAIYRAIRFRGTAELSRPRRGRGLLRLPALGVAALGMGVGPVAPGRRPGRARARWQDVLERFPDTGSDHDVPVPDFWGGWRIVLRRGTARASDRVAVDARAGHGTASRRPNLGAAHVRSADRRGRDPSRRSAHAVRGDGRGADGDGRIDAARRDRLRSNGAGAGSHGASRDRAGRSTRQGGYACAEKKQRLVDSDRGCCDARGSRWRRVPLDSLASGRAAAGANNRAGADR